MIIKLDLTPKQAEQLYWVSSNLPIGDKSPAGRATDKLREALAERLAQEK